MDKHYTVCDGTLVLELWPAEEGGYNVTSPLDPELITQAETLEDAFEMAYDARQALQEAREKRFHRPSPPHPTVEAGDSNPSERSQTQTHIS